jgi:hypothetical protein
MKADASGAGLRVPDGAIALLGRDMESTADEARHSPQVRFRSDAARGDLAFHVRRARMIFTRFRGAVPVIGSRYEPLPWRGGATTSARNVVLETLLAFSRPRNQT